MRVEFDGVTKRFGGTVALSEIGLTVAAGERVALVGPSGSGKSTLLRLAALLDVPSRGSVRLDGRVPDGSESRLQLARAACLLLQKPVMLKRSVSENVAYGMKVRSQERGSIEAAVAEELDRLEIGRLADRYAPRLSGGEQQRVALARALITRPRLLLLDEFTSNLDPANSRLVERVVTGHCERAEATLLFATHNPQQARRMADRVALVLGGRLVELAPTERFFSAPAAPETRAFLAGEIPY